MNVDLDAIRSLLDTLAARGHWPFTREQRAAAAELDANAHKYLAALCDEVERLRTAVQRVRALHQPRKGASIPWAACSCGCPSHSGCFTAQALRALDGAE